MTGSKLDKFAEHDSIRVLEEKGYRVEKDLPHEPRVAIPIRPSATFKWAVVACTHLGGKFQQLTHLRDFCKRAIEVHGVERIWHVGDVLMGSSRRHDYIYEAFKHGATAQHDYAAEVLPVTGVPWEVITGNHDEWWWQTEGVDTGVELALRRSDVRYVGRRAARLDIGGLYVYLRHGEGGVPYALSYRLQRTIERMNPRPDVYLIANWHSALYMPGYAGSELLMAPCFQATTPFERSRGLTPTIGGFILTIDIEATDVWRIVPEFVLYKTSIENDY